MDILTVRAAREKIAEIAYAEKNKEFKDKTRIAVKGVLTKIETPRNDGKYQDVYIREDVAEGKDGKPHIYSLKITLSNNKWRQDVGKLTENDKETEQVFSGVASVWEQEDNYGEIIPQYSLYGEIGEGKQQNKPWNPYGRITNPVDQRRIFGTSIFNAARAEGKNTDEAIAEITPQRIDAFIEACKESKVETESEDPFE